MNQLHLDYLVSPEWAKRLEMDLLPWIERVAELGDDVIEVGPGPGLTTDIIRRRTARVTAVDIDDGLVAALRERMTGTNVDVVHGDATRLDMPSDRFSAATCFNMLHHVPSPEEQDRVLVEILRVLRPGGALFATDARDTELLRAAHDDDTFVPLSADTVVSRLETLGYVDIDLEVTEYEMRFAAHKAA